MATLRLRSLRLVHFRAHTSSELILSDGINLFVGPNGAGKTNLIEAVGYLCLGKSLFASSDQHVLQRGASFFEVEGVFCASGRAEMTIRLASLPGEGKRAFINGVPLDRLSSLVGRVPFVLMSPADYDLTAGGPSERRRFLDATLSQAFPVYLDDLMKYRRALKQKNALLLQARKSRSHSSTALDAWDEELAVLGGRVMERRTIFLTRFESFLSDAYQLLQSPGGALGIEYVPSESVLDGQLAADVLRESLQRTRRRSLDLGRTLVGPHLDEVAFLIDRLALRPYASQGQHRTFALAVRLAQALYFRDHVDALPLLLLDDVFGPLDPSRSQVVLDLLSSQVLGQSLVTAARLEPFLPHAPFHDPAHTVFHVEQGTISSAPLSPSSEL